MGRIKSSFHKMLFFLSHAQTCLHLKACAIVRGAIAIYVGDNPDLSTDTNESDIDTALREQLKIMSKIRICGIYYHPAVSIENENTQLLKEHVNRVVPRIK